MAEKTKTAVEKSGTGADEGIGATGVVWTHPRQSHPARRRRVQRPVPAAFGRAHHGLPRPLPDPGRGRGLLRGRLPEGRRKEELRDSPHRGRGGRRRHPREITALAAKTRRQTTGPLGIPIRNLERSGEGARRLEITGCDFKAPAGHQHGPGGFPCASGVAGNAPAHPARGRLSSRGRARCAEIGFYRRDSKR